MKKVKNVPFFGPVANRFNRSGHLEEAGLTLPADVIKINFGVY